MFFHSHPIDGKNAHWEDAIVPSTADIENSERRSLNRRGMINGIVAPDKKGARIFLWQFDPDSPHDTYYQTFENGQSLAIFRRLLNESGVRNAVLALPAKAEAFSPDETAKLATFSTAA